MSVHKAEPDVSSTMRATRVLLLRRADPQGARWARHDVGAHPERCRRWVLPDDEANGDGKAASYVPTHRSKLDGSEAMQVGTLSALVLRNENGDEWVDNTYEWEAL